MPAEVAELASHWRGERGGGRGPQGSEISAVHIGFTTDYLDPDDACGSGRVIAEVATRLAATGHRVTVVAGGRERGERSWRPGAGDPVLLRSFPYRTRGRRGFGFFGAVRREVRAAVARLESLPDVWIHNQPLTGAAAADRSRPAVYLFHSPWPLEHMAQVAGEERLPSLLVDGPRTCAAVAARRWLEHRAVTRCQAWVTLSRTMRRWLCGLHGVPAERVRVLPGGVDLERFQPLERAARAAARRRLGVAPEEFLIVTVRRLVRRTGVDILVDALAELAGRTGRDRRATARVGDGRPWRCLIAGRGPEADAIAERVAHAGLGERVRLLGFVPDAELPELLGAADLAAVPTRALEGFGLATLEALACGTPVIATPVGGSVEILDMLEPELLADAPDARALARALASWCGDRRGEISELRGRCRRFAERRCDWQRMAHGIEDLARATVGVGNAVAASPAARAPRVVRSST